MENPWIWSWTLISFGAVYWDEVGLEQKRFQLPQIRFPVNTNPFPSSQIFVVSCLVHGNRQPYSILYNNNFWYNLIPFIYTGYLVWEFISRALYPNIHLLIHSLIHSVNV